MSADEARGGLRHRPSLLFDKADYPKESYFWETDAVTVVERFFKLYSDTHAAIDAAADTLLAEA